MNECVVEQQRMKELASELNAASRSYYHEDREIITNLEYDALYDELVELETKTGIRLGSSPTGKVGFEVVGSLTKVTHDAPLLSLDKTKDPEELRAFLHDREGILSWKLDGLRIVLKYADGELRQALTRGNGVVGEDVTHTARVFANIPKVVPFKGNFTLQGEAVIHNHDFEEINAHEEFKYKNPRNLCSGTVRQLSSEAAAKRRVFFYAFAPVESAESDVPADLKSTQLQWLVSQGFETVEYMFVNESNIADAVESFKNRVVEATVASDGLVLTLNDISYSRSLGATSKFPRDSLAFKWTDELVETVLTHLEWNTSRTGLVNPVAVFEPVEIEGSTVSRASLHNVSILRSLELCPGDRITVYKANMIIPQVAENLSRTDEPREVDVPCVCPVCGGKTEIVGEPETLYCTNPGCEAQKIRLLSHFVSRDALNIAGLSEQTLEKFVGRDFIADYMDLFELSKHENAIIEMEGFGRKSYDNLIASIESAKDVPMPNFIFALGIRHVGLANAKLLCSYFEFDPVKIMEASQSDDFAEILSEVKGFGPSISNSLHEFFTSEKNVSRFERAIEALHFPPAPPEAEDLPLKGSSFVITGDVAHFENRRKMQEFIEAKGGKVTSSISAKTSYLINNNSTSTSSKNKKAAELGIPIITENELLEMCM